MPVRIFIISIIAIMMSACTDSAEVQVTVDELCSKPESKAQLAKFIVDCSKAANPMSDEEGEDLVAQCERTGRRTLCPSEKFCRVHYDRSFPDQDRWTSWTTDCKLMREEVKRFNKEQG